MRRCRRHWSLHLLIHRDFAIIRSIITDRGGKLHTTVQQSNSIYLLSYNDLFVFVLMHLIWVAGAWLAPQTVRRRVIKPISWIYSYFVFLSFSYKVALCQYSLFHSTPNVIFVYSATHKNKYARVAVYIIEIRSTILQSCKCDVCTKNYYLLQYCVYKTNTTFIVTELYTVHSINSMNEQWVQTSTYPCRTSHSSF